MSKISFRLTDCRAVLYVMAEYLSNVEDATPSLRWDIFASNSIEWLTLEALTRYVVSYGSL